MSLIVSITAQHRAVNVMNYSLRVAAEHEGGSDEEREGRGRGQEDDGGRLDRQRARR